MTVACTIAADTGAYAFGKTPGPHPADQHQPQEDRGGRGGRPCMQHGRRAGILALPAVARPGAAFLY